MSTLNPFLVLSSFGLVFLFSVVSLSLSAKILAIALAVANDEYYSYDSVAEANATINIITGSSLSLLFSLIMAIYAAVLLGMASVRFHHASIFKKHTRPNGVGVLVMATLQGLTNIVDLGLLGGAGVADSEAVGGGVTGVLGALVGIAIGVLMIRNNGTTTSAGSRTSEKALPQYTTDLQPHNAAHPPRRIELNGLTYVVQENGRPAAYVSSEPNSPNARCEHTEINGHTYIVQENGRPAAHVSLGSDSPNTRCACPHDTPNPL